MPRYVRFKVVGKYGWGRVVDDGVQPVNAGPLAGGVPDDVGGVLPWAALSLEPPVRPSKIVAVGRNYADHARELDHDIPEEPLLFLKPPSCLIAHGDAIVHPTASRLVHHEGELAIIIGRRTRDVTAAQAPEHILGYAPFNDVTARDLQRKDVQFTRGKGFDTFGPLGPWIDTDFAPDDQRISVRVNGELRQDGRLGQMIFDPAFVVSYISRVMTLEPGDVIATGTPAGVGPLVPGDRVEVDIEGLGVLENHVVGDDLRSG